LFCIDELDADGNPFWNEKTLYGGAGHHARGTKQLTISVISCGSEISLGFKNPSE
jgi:hypothetical protein